jgi:hypothetical protein
MWEKIYLCARLTKKLTPTMKKTLTLVALAGMFAFSSCGPSKEELEKKQKAHDDSVAHVNDSIANANKMKAQQDSIDNAKKMMEEKEKMRQDSIRVADSLAHAKGPKKSGGTKPPPPKEIKHTTAPKGKG